MPVTTPSNNPSTGRIPSTRSTADTKCISRLTFDPNDPSVVYAGSTGSGLLRSTDRGATWALMAHQPPISRFMAVVVDPGDSDSIYIASFDNQTVPGGEVGVFATRDGGDTWVKMTGAGFPIWDLRFVQVGTDNWLYAATMDGLRFLRAIPLDPAVPWETAAGIPGMATVDGFNAVTEDGRIVYYIGTSGGTLPGLASAGSAFLTWADETQYFAGGVYRSMALESQVGIPGWRLSGRGWMIDTRFKTTNRSTPATSPPACPTSRAAPRSAARHGTAWPTTCSRW